jgi:Ca2+/Na+ antiporter
MSGSRGQSGIVVARTAESNIFLLTPCVGIIALAGTPNNSQADNLVLFELVVTWLSSVMFLMAAFLGLGRSAGIAFLASYVAFLILEFTVYRR